TGQLVGAVRADQGTSFQAMQPKLDYFRRIIMNDPAVESITGYSGGRGGSHSSFTMIQLKPLAERDGVSAFDVANRLRLQLSGLPGSSMFLMPRQEIRIGGRQSNSAYQYSLMATEVADL